MPTSAPPVLVLFRDDLRTADQPALLAAAETGQPIIPLYIRDETARARSLGGAARWWLHHALQSLSKDLAALGADLLILRSEANAAILDLADKTGATGVFWNRRYGLAERDADAALKTALGARDISAKSFNGHLLREPWEIKSQSGTHFRVYTPFYRAARAMGDPPAPKAAPKALNGFDWRAAGIPGLALDTLELLPHRPDWAAGLRAEWTPGSAGAAKRLEAFLDGAVRGYAEDRNLPDRLSTSRLSPHLRFGEISIRQVWHSAIASFRSGRSKAGDADQETFLKELFWREFSYHLLYHHPDLATANHQHKFDGFPWREDPAGLRAWQRGETGYPIVDAGMRELWRTGWMHNRVRMIVGSFLVKHLLIDWRKGEEWFWDTLVDADPANNAASWQWVAGSGADAAPYFRIFNPVAQGEKFDPDGGYVRHYVPEISVLPNRFIHRPWDAPPLEKIAAGVKPGGSYPVAIVEHEKARQRALSAFKSISSSAA
jgi:deoxyribodipyrimidine photo-lyase